MKYLISLQVYGYKYVCVQSFILISGLSPRTSASTWDKVIFFYIFCGSWNWDRHLLGYFGFLL